MQPDPRPPDTGTDRPVFPNPQGAFEDKQQAFTFDTEAVRAAQTSLDAQAPESGEDGEVSSQSRLPKVIAFVLLALGIIFFLRYQVFTISSLRIKGTNSIPWETVAQAAGLDRGLFYFSVEEDEIRQGIDANRYLVFEGMEKVFPNTLVLNVRERAPFAYLTHLGIGYIIAQDGMILEQTRDLGAGRDLIAVSGLSLWGEIRPGSFPSSTDPSQVEGLLDLFSEISVWGFDTQVRSVDVAHNLNISLMTVDGYTVNLGLPENLYAKIGTVQSVVSELRRRQMLGGIIEAAMPGEATYRAVQL